MDCCSVFTRWIFLLNAASLPGNLDNRGEMTDRQTKTSRYCLSTAYYRSVLTTIKIITNKTKTNKYCLSTAFNRSILTTSKFLRKRIRPIKNLYPQPKVFYILATTTSRELYNLRSINSQFPFFEEIPNRAFFSSLIQARVSTFLGWFFHPPLPF